MAELLKPFYNPGPGDIIKDAMEESGWMQEDLSEILGLSLKSVNLILNNKQSITPETAELLGKAFSTSAELWLNLDAKYQLRKIENSENTRKNLTEAKAQMRRIMPVSEIKKKGWFINNVDTIEGIKAEKSRVFGDDNTEKDSQMKFCVRQTSFDHDYTLSYCNTWYHYACLFARKYDLCPYSEQKLKDLAGRFCDYTVMDNGIEKVIKALAECGVGFFVLSHLQKTYLDGAAFIIDEKPFIVYTGRYDRIDNFWFVLAHEIAHILLHYSELERGYLDNMDTEANSKIEEEADIKANELLKAQYIIEEGKKYAGYLSYARLIDISNHIHISIPVIVGVLQYNKIIDWKKFSKLKETVKDKIPMHLLEG